MPRSKNGDLPMKSPQMASVLEVPGVFSTLPMFSHLETAYRDKQIHIHVFVYLDICLTKTASNFQTCSRNSYTIPTLWMTFSHSRCDVGCFGFVD